MSANRVDLGFFCFHKFSNFTPPPPPGLIVRIADAEGQDFPILPGRGCRAPPSTTAVGGGGMDTCTSNWKMSFVFCMCVSEMVR